MITIENPKLDRNWSAVAAALTDGLVELSTGNIASIYTTTKKVRGAETLATPTVEQLAGEWVMLALTEAAVRMMREDPRFSTALTPKHLNAEAAKFVDAAMAFPNDCALAPVHLINPASCAAFDTARAAAPGFMTTIAPDHGASDKAIEALFDRCLNLQAGRVQYAEPAHFASLIEQLNGKASEPQRREMAWARHENWIRGQWDCDPIFAQDTDSGITLARTYLPLRCFWHEEIQPKDPGEAISEWSAHVGWLHAAVHGWLDAPKNCKIQLVAGSPGCGKSSFARALAVEMLDNASTKGQRGRVLLIRLQNLKMEEDLAAALAKHMTAMHRPAKAHGAEGLPGDPLAWLKEDDIPLLLIFDGLDELSHESKSAEAHTERFLLSLKTMLADWSEDELLAIVLGRSSACQAAMRAAHIDQNRLLHVMPMRALNMKKANDEALIACGRKLGGVDDPLKLLGDDQRAEFYLKCAGLLSLPDAAAPDAVTADSMEALNSEPLLLYLLMLAGYSGDRWEEAQVNPNLVYEAIFQKVCSRNASKNPAGSDGLSEADFFLLMECLGLAAWQGNGRTGQDADFQRIRQAHGTRALRNRLKNNPLSKLRNVAIQIYTRSDFNEGEGFEFVHKSFGEYLVGRALASAGRRMAQRLSGDERETHKEVAPDWIALVGAGELTPEIMGFLCRERHVEPDASLDALEPFLQEALHDGFPLHQAPGAHGASWRDLASRERCASTALLAVISAVAQRCDDVLGDNGAAPRRFRLLPIPTIAEIVEDGWATLKTLERLEATAGGGARFAMSRADLIGANLNEANLNEAKLIGADLRGANLSRANLREADLSGANLNGADLSGADLIGANLSWAKLHKAKLHKADLIGANLNEADLSWADLSGADLSGANLRGADLREADLSGANLNGADLSGASLNGANLHKAKLHKADLREANLRGADLREANLSGANLNGASLNGASLNGANLSWAKLHRAELHEAKLHKADLREANLRGAKLSGADLSGASLNGANLNGVDLSGADLSGADLNGAILIGAILSGADLSRAILREAELHEARLHEADLSWADLRGANLRGANLNGADLVETKSLSQVSIDSAHGDASTKLPPSLTRPAHWI
jgi:uncharacterized protein YjbI with pentapeptide repeats